MTMKMVMMKINKYYNHNHYIISLGISNITNLPEIVALSDLIISCSPNMKHLDVS